MSSPRERRLEADFRAMNALRDESTIIQFDTAGAPVDRYRVVFHGYGLWRANASAPVVMRDRHEVSITLNAAYPRMVPELAWLTPIFHPNISASGVVCLGGYGSHWAHSLKLDELCIMLWDMIRFENYDIESPYNREAALWARSQTEFRFPIDGRPLRNRISAGILPPDSRLMTGLVQPDMVTSEIVEIVDAELIEPVFGSNQDKDKDILFLD